MEELKPKIVDIQAKRRLKAASSQTSPLNQCPRMSRTESIQKVATVIKPLQPQLMPELPLSNQTRKQRLAAQAELINQLAAQLEEAMFELKAIATEINCDRRIQQNTQKPPQPVCEYLTAVVPCVTQKQSGTFVLTNRSVDLFRAEREANQVAQALRCLSLSKLV